MIIYGVIMCLEDDDQTNLEGLGHYGTQLSISLEIFIPVGKQPFSMNCTGHNVSMKNVKGLA